MYVYFTYLLFNKNIWMKVLMEMQFLWKLVVLSVLTK